MEEVRAAGQPGLRGHPCSLRQPVHRPAGAARHVEGHRYALLRSKPAIGAVTAWGVAAAVALVPAGAIVDSHACQCNILRRRK